MTEAGLLHRSWGTSRGAAPLPQGPAPCPWQWVPSEREDEPRSVWFTYTPQPQCPLGQLEAGAPASSCCCLAMASTHCPQQQPQSWSALCASGLGAKQGPLGGTPWASGAQAHCPPPTSHNGAQAEAPGSFWSQQRPEVCGAEPAPPLPRLPSRGWGQRGHSSRLFLPQLLQLGRATSFFRQSWSSSLSHRVSHLP